MSRQRRHDINAAIDDIRAFYAMGQEIGPKPPHADAYGHGLIKNKANELDLGPDTVCKARQFADENEGFTKAEFKQLCDSIIALQANQDVSKPIFGKTQAMRLLTVKPKKVRTKLLQEALKNAWSAAELKIEIRKRFGTRQAGGRRRRIPLERTDLLTQMEGMCEEWRRWHAAMDRLGKVDGEYPLHELPRQVQTKIAEARKCLDDLHHAVNRELTKLLPKRKARQVDV